MRKITKKIISTLITLTMLVSVYTTAVFADTAQTQAAMATDINAWQVVQDLDSRNFNGLDASSVASSTNIGSIVSKVSGNWALSTTYKTGASGEGLQLIDGGEIQLRPDRFTAANTAGKIYRVTYDFCLDALPTSELGWDIKFNTAGWKSGFHILADGSVKLAGAAVSSVKVNEWHNITYVVDYTDGTYECYFDGKLANKLQGGASDKIIVVKIKGAGNSVYLDNVSIALVASTEQSQAPMGDEINAWNMVQTLDSRNFDGLTASAVASATNIGSIVSKASGTWALSTTYKSGTSGEGLQATSGTTVRLVPSRFSAANASGKVYMVKFDFCMDALPSSEAGWDIKFNTSGWKSGFHIFADGTVKLAGATVSSININEWHNIAYVVDFTAGTYVCYFDGEQANTLSGGASEPIPAMDIVANGNNVYLDNVSISLVEKNPDYVSYIYNEDFDGGLTAGKWLVAENVAYYDPASWTQSSDIKHGDSGKSVYIPGSHLDVYLNRITHSDHWAVSVDLYFDQLPASGANYEISTKAIVNGVEGWHYASLRANADEWTISGVHGGSADVDGKKVTIKEDNWVNLMLEWDMNKKEHYVYVDNELYGVVDMSDFDSIVLFRLFSDNVAYYMDNFKFWDVADEEPVFEIQPTRYYLSSSNVTKAIIAVENDGSERSLVAITAAYSETSGTKKLESVVVTPITFAAGELYKKGSAKLNADYSGGDVKTMFVETTDTLKPITAPHAY